MRCFVWSLLLGCSVCLHLWAPASWAGKQTLAALLIACHAGDCEAVRAHLHENRDLARKAVITEQSERGYTALDVAAGGGYVEIIRLLLEAGADVNSRAGAAGRTPLMQVGLHASCKSCLPILLRRLHYHNSPARHNQNPTPPVRAPLSTVCAF